MKSKYGIVMCMLNGAYWRTITMVSGLNGMGVIQDIERRYPVSIQHIRQLQCNPNIYMVQYRSGKHEPRNSTEATGTGTQRGVGISMGMETASGSEALHTQGT